jgi:hypothetical protein
MPHETDAAFLHHDAVLPRNAAGRQPGVAAAQRGMAGEGQFAAGREDAHAVVGTGVGGRQQERGLRQVRPAREVGHRASSRPRASCTTASGLPRSGTAVNTSS